MAKRLMEVTFLKNIGNQAKAWPLKLDAELLTTLVYYGPKQIDWVKSRIRSMHEKVQTEKNCSYYLSDEKVQIISNASQRKHDLTEEDVLSMNQMCLELRDEETEYFDDYAHRVTSICVMRINDASPWVVLCTYP